ncbi:LysR family transcriptional regulator [Muricoccus radiodurans]|uniref:LysR family transcriptional regulator n=1 Tax=Muricoccus radiodurans TaxID=2231721 RepID=UPI003CEF10C1
MNPTLRQFEAFTRVARLGSFARAAEALGLSQPALSQTIAQMERLLDVRLFERTTRSVSLTPEGAFLLPRAEAIVTSIGDVVTALKEQHRRRQSRLSVGSLPSLATGLLPDILRRYRERHPAAEVAVTDGTSEILYAGVEAGQIDLAISSRLPDHAGVAFQPLLRERFLLVLRRDHPLARRAEVTWRDALRHDFIAFLRGSGGQAAIEEALAGTDLVLNPVMTLAQSSTVLGMVEAGVGVTALPVLGCPPADHRVLTTRTLIEPAVDREVGFLLAVSRAPTAGVLALQALTMDYVARNLVPGIAPVC